MTYGRCATLPNLALAPGQKETKQFQKGVVAQIALHLHDVARPRRPV
jgi:hypothetical protein